MRTLHGGALRGHSIPAGAHTPAGVFASQVYASLHRDSARACKRLASSRAIRPAASSSLFLRFAIALIVVDRVSSAAKPLIPIQLSAPPGAEMHDSACAAPAYPI